MAEHGKIEDSQADNEIAPTAGSVGNHHWPSISNIFEAHGNKFPKHHDHAYPLTGQPLGEIALKLTHRYTEKKAHEASARYHEPKNEEGCR